MVLTVRIFALLFFWQMLPARLLADEALQHSNLKRIEAEVAAKTGELNSLNQKIDDLQRQLAAGKLKLAELEKKVRDIGQALRKVEIDRESLQAELSTYQQELAVLNSVSRQRLKVAYLHRSEQVVGGLFFQRDFLAMMRNLFYLSKLAQFDRSLAEKVLRLRKGRKERIRQLSQLIQNHDLLKQSLLAQQLLLKEGINEQVKTKAALAARKKEMEEALLSLRAEALRLETVVKSLTGGPDTDRRVRIPKAASARAESTERAENTYMGKGLEGKKGRLILPVSGKVLKKFGKHRVSQFSDFVFIKGVEFFVPAAGRVSAVAGGRVMYSGRMPGYGQILIIDHGQRYYSLYGRLSQPVVAVGDIVKPGQSVAEVGPQGDSGSNFYFELRKNGSPIDPALFYPELSP